MKRFLALALFCLPLLAQNPPIAGIDYPAPIPVPFVGYTVTTGSDPELCTPGMSPLNYRSDTAAYEFCSTRNVWTLFNGQNGAVSGTTGTFSGAVSPATAGNVALGTAADPWGSLVLGTAATNAGTITPASMSAARAITLADPGGAATLAYTNPTSTQNIVNTGTITPTGGIVQSTVTVPFTTFTTYPPLLAALIASSTDIGTSAEALSKIFIPVNATLTGACVLAGSGTMTDSWVGVLRNAGGTAVAHTATAGTALATASIENCVAFTGTVAVVGPQTYYLGFQASGATANQVYLYATGAAPGNYGCGQVSATYGTVASSVSVPTTFTGAKCVVGSVY